MKNNLTTKEAISIVCIIFLCQLVLNLPKGLINNCGTGSIINVLYISILALILCFFISKLLKSFPSLDIIDISEFVGGNILKFVVSIIYIVFFIILILVALSDFSYLLKCIYFQNAPPTFILAFFIFGALIANLFGFTSIKKACTITLPILFFSFLLIFIEIIPEMSLNDFTPILGYNYKSTFVTGLSNAFLLSFFNLYFFIMPLLKKKNDMGKIIFTSFSINCFVILITIISLIAVFTARINANNINALYFLARTIKLSDFIRQIDAIYVFIWILSLFSYISILIYFVTHILNKLFHFKNQKQLTYPIVNVLSGLSLLFVELDQIQFLQNKLFKYSSLFITFGVGLLLLILGNIKKHRKALK